MKNAILEVNEYRSHLIKYLLRLAPNTNLNELDELVSHFTLDKISKKEIILKSGDFSDTVYFIFEGLVRIYYVKEDKEITNWFVKENMMFTATYAILTGCENYSNYEALEDTSVLKIKYSELESFYTKYHTLEHLGRKIIESYYGSFMKKTYDVLFLSAEERYQIFVNEQSDLMNRLPLRFVASFLGITPETLSRLRSRH